MRIILVVYIFIISIIAITCFSCNSRNDVKQIQISDDNVKLINEIRTIGSFDNEISSNKELHSTIQSCPEDMIYVPPGRFTIGCTEQGESCIQNEPVDVFIKDGYCIDKYETTQFKYIIYLLIKNTKNNLKYPSTHSMKHVNNPSFFVKCGANCPVENISWLESSQFCKFHGKELPTELQWEYAARAGTRSKYYWGNKFDGDYAWISVNSHVDYKVQNCMHCNGKGTHPVGMKKPNGFGIYDITGNVSEWVLNDYSGNGYEYLKTFDIENKHFDENGYTLKVIRGGNWESRDGQYLYISSRYMAEAHQRGNKVGFRCVLNRLQGH